jgi:hypothetical protein
MWSQKLWVSLSKHSHTMWPFRSLHGMLSGLWQLPYLHNPDHQYCARQASALRTMNGSKTHLGGTWFSIKKSQCSPPIPSIDVALDNNLISLKSHCDLLWTFYEGLLIDSLVVFVLVVLVPFPLSYLTLAMATLHLLKPWRVLGLVKLLVRWA